jgi:hypothetical protein
MTRSVKQKIKQYPITFGLSLIIIAYAFDTLGILFDSGDIIFKLLNLVGSIFIALPLLKFKNYNAFLIAFIWFVISFYAVFKAII